MNDCRFFWDITEQHFTDNVTTQNTWRWSSIQIDNNLYIINFRPVNDPPPVEFTLKKFTLKKLTEIHLP